MPRVCTSSLTLFFVGKKEFVIVVDKFSFHVLNSSTAILWESLSRRRCFQTCRVSPAWSAVLGETNVWLYWNGLAPMAEPPQKPWLSGAKMNQKLIRSFFWGTFFFSTHPEFLLKTQLNKLWWEIAGIIGPEVESALEDELDSNLR